MTFFLFDCRSAFVADAVFGICTLLRDYIMLLFIWQEEWRFSIINDVFQVLIFTIK